MFRIEFENGRPARVICDTAEEAKAIMQGGHVANGNGRGEKSGAVRNYLAKHPKAKPAEVAAALAADDVSGTPASVSSVKTSLRPKRRTRRKTTASK